MGASIYVNLAQAGINETARTANVSIAITVTSTAGTHNHFNTADRGAVLYVTIDGSSYEYVTPFGSEETGTFTSTIFSTTVTVPYNSDGTRTVFVSATLATGTTGGGSPSDSASITLTPISSGGSSGGGDDGGEEWEDPDNPGSGGSDPDNPGSGSGDSSDSTPPPFESNVGVYGFWDGTKWGSSIAYIGYNEQGGRCATLGFYTNQYETGRSTSVDIAMKANGVGNGVQTVGVALATARYDNPPYSGADLDVYDPYQIAVITMTLADGKYSEVSIPTRVLERDNAYYLYLWIPPDYYSSDSPYSLDFSDGIEIRVNYTEDDSDNTVQIDTNGTGFETYTIFIDTDGTGFEEYEAWIDNGVFFEPYP